MSSSFSLSQFVPCMIYLTLDKREKRKKKKKRKKEKRKKKKEMDS
jgi:hypothetical protein